MKFLSAIILLFMCSFYGYGQSFFKGGVIMGINAAQLDGDNNYGYNKLGLTGGITMGIPLEKNFDLFVEFLYSQQGAIEKFRIIPTSKDNGIKLNYLSMPIILRWKDWYIEDKGFHRFWLDFGVSPGRLFQTKIVGSPEISAVADQFKSYDVAGVIGGGIALNKHVQLNLRFTKSFYRLYNRDKHVQNKLEYLIGYFFSFRSVYLF